MVFLHLSYLFPIKSYDFKRTPNFRIFTIFAIISLRNSSRKLWPKSWKSKNRVYVWNYNFWLEYNMIIVKIPIALFLTNKKVKQKIVSKKLLFTTCIQAKSHGSRLKIVFFQKSFKNRFFQLPSPKKSSKISFSTAK